MVNQLTPHQFYTAHMKHHTANTELPNLCMEIFFQFRGSAWAIWGESWFCISASSLSRTGKARPEQHIGETTSRDQTQQLSDRSMSQTPNESPPWLQISRDLRTAQLPGHNKPTEIIASTFSRFSIMMAISHIHFAMIAQKPCSRASRAENTLPGFITTL